MTHKTVPLITLETARLRIVPLDRASFDEKRHAPADDPMFGTEEFREAMDELAERAAHDRKTRFAWYTNRLIYRKEDGAYVGSIAFMNSPEKDPDHVGLIEIGYATEEAYRGQGYMTEAVGGVIRYIPNYNGNGDEFERIIIVSPIYSFGLPVHVYDMIPRLTKNRPVWVVLNYGGMTGGADAFTYRYVSQIS